MRRYGLMLPVILLLLSAVGSVYAEQTARKDKSMFYPVDLITRAKTNVAKYPWAAEIQKDIVKAAEPWMSFSDNQLWDMMFGCTITRSWMVWSDGHCPSCKTGVPMYVWHIDAMVNPWKVQCPHCKEYFPKNDFHKFYRSGLDEYGVFDAKLADRSLLYNTEHPEPSDPLHKFGVDDGEGYVDGDKRWRFIGTYLIYGQWKQAVLGGIQKLSDAYSVTGDPKYAHKAGVLLDRVADLYPTFDFGKQGVVYEHPGLTGYVSTWHDACEETRQLALAYDQIREAIRQDKDLAVFLAAKSRHYKLDNAKASCEDIQKNIEDGILRDVLANPKKIRSNYPRTPIALATIKAVLGWPENREEVFAELDEMVKTATSVDGVTGEKGLAGYTSFTIQGLAILLEQFSKLDESFLKDLLQRRPNIHKTFRFHIDTHCLNSYYPQIGDTGGFALKNEHYVGVGFSKNPGMNPSMYSFLWHLYQVTGDTAFLQVLYRENDNSVKSLPYDLFAEDPEAVQKTVKDIVDREGKYPKLESINKEKWHLAILRSGEGENARALWLDYDSGGSHGHMDGMNLGLFAMGLDLMPEFGYKPVNYGGWGSPRANWYGMTASHNTVVVDGQDQKDADGKTTLWADGKTMKAIRASCPQLVGGQQYERTAVMVEVSDTAFYVLDVFRVVGGTDHAKFLYSHFGTITTQGLSLKPAADYGHKTQMRNFQCDPKPQAGWSVDWKVEDRRKALPEGSEVHYKYTDLTNNAEAYTSEAWILAGHFNTNDEAWIPSAMTRCKSSKAPLASTFVGVIEPYKKQSSIQGIRRLSLEAPDGAVYPDSNAAVEVTLVGGGRDLIVSADVENPLKQDPSFANVKAIVQKDWQLQTDGELALVRCGSSKDVKKVVLCNGSFITVGKFEILMKEKTRCIEINIDRGKADVVSGNAEAVSSIKLNGQEIQRL